MDCPSCVGRIQRHLHDLEGVVEVHGSPVARTLTVTMDPKAADQELIVREVGRLGYSARPSEGRDRIRDRPPIWTTPRARSAAASAVLFGVGLALRLLGWDPALFQLPLHPVHLADLAFVAAAGAGGLSFFGRGLRAARTLSLDMNFLMTVAVLGAIGIGEYLEAGAIAFLFSVAHLLENYSVDRARASVEALMELAPDTARLIRNGTEVFVPVEELAAGDEVAVRPGDRIPTDGSVVSGASAVDESPITGESMPVDKAKDARVYAGTINRAGYLRIRVDRQAEESTLARIIRMVQEAESRKAVSERFVERFSRYYTPAVTVGAVALMAVPPLVFGEPFGTWFLRGLTLLVIACPCALVISTPVAVVSGITAAARNGVLIKGGSYLEAMGGVRALAVDKTGTLTYGHPEVVSIRPAPGVDEDDALARAAAVEKSSEHPIGRALVDAARHRGLEAPWDVTDFRAEPGQGARASLDGQEYRVGRPEPEPMVEAGGGPLTASRAHQGMGSREDMVALREESGFMATASELAEAGETVVGLTDGERVLAWFGLADRPREEARQAVTRLHDLGVRPVVLLTGDRREVAEAIGGFLGVDDVRADLMPEEKVAAIEELRRRHGGVAMVGDGVNDAPALAAATVGVAMGAAGSDTALETADVALMGDDLSRLPYLHALSHKARRVIRQNIAAAIGVKVILAAGVPLGHVSLIAAVLIGDLGVSLAVIGNALRLAHLRP